MPNRILLGGTVAIDDIITPHDKAMGVLGGSASYAAVAARLFSPDIDVLSVIGTDFPQKYKASLENHGINLENVTIRQGESFKWAGEYFNNMNERRTVHANDEVMTGWSVAVPGDWQNHPVIVAACMVPARQLELMGQCHSPKLVLSDSMNKWIDRQPELLDQVISLSDVCTMNEEEAKIYSKTSSIIEAGTHLLNKGAKYAIIKQGEYGSILFAQVDNRSPKIFRCPAWPLKTVIDPTGAGDTFIGALGGYLATKLPEGIDFSIMKQAVVRATIAASFTCESFSADALFEMTKDTFTERLKEFIGMIVPD